VIAPMPAVFSGPKRLGLEEVHTAANRSVLCPHQGLVAKASPARNPASRFGYEGPGGPISVGATRSTLVALSDIAPSIQRAQPAPAIAPQAQRTFDVVPLRMYKVLFQHIRQRADGTPRSANSCAFLNGPGPYVVFARLLYLKRLFDF
jgi:hypothetical protein